MDLNFFKAQENDIPGLKSLWLLCFEEKPEALDLFFERNFGSSSVYACKKEGKIVSAVYLVPCSVSGRQAHYLCGAATNPSCRGMGIMRRLIGFALKNAQADGDCFSLLFPAEQGLYDYYGSLGYVRGCSAAVAVIDRSRLGEPTQRAQEGSPDMQEMQSACHGKNCVLWSNGFLRFAADYYGMYGTRAAYNERAFALYDIQSDEADVFYCAYNDINELKSLLSKLDVRRIKLTLNPGNRDFEAEKIIICGMLRPLGGFEPPKDLYIGITLN